MFKATEIDSSVALFFATDFFRLTAFSKSGLTFDNSSAEGIITGFFVYHLFEY